MFVKQNEKNLMNIILYMTNNAMRLTENVK